MMQYCKYCAPINGLPITVAFIMPYQTAERECFQISIKACHRNKLKEKYLDVLMSIKTSICSVADFGYELAINMWKEKKACRIYKNESSIKSFEAFLQSCFFNVTDLIK